MKINKYIYLYVIQGSYGQGFEDVDQSDSYQEARHNYKLYRENETQYPHRLIQRRELNPKWAELQLKKGK